MPADPVPQDLKGAIPVLVVRDIADAITFYTKAFGAREHARIEIPDMGIVHVEMRLQDQPFMLAPETDDLHSPHSLGGAAVSMLVYTADSDALFDQALAADAALLRPMQDQFYGDRSGAVEDPFGHIWTIASRLEDLSAGDIQQRAEEFFKEE